MAKRQAKTQRQNRIADGNGLCRAFTPRRGDTFIFPDQIVVEGIIDDEVWIKRNRIDGVEDYRCYPLTKWRELVRQAMRNGAVFKAA